MLRTCMRNCSKSSPILEAAAFPTFQLLRSLTSNQTAIALRPFYFIVHPDLFGKYPKERAINEESLKHLRQHLEKLQQENGQRVKPIDLLFYIRQNDPVAKARVYPKPSEFQQIWINLKPTTVKNTVRTILESCSLSVDYIESIKPTLVRPATFPRTVKWDPTFYSYYGIPNPDEGERTKKTVTLGGWLNQNVSAARRKQDQIRPIRQEVERLHGSILEEIGLGGVEWGSTWGQTQYRTALRGLRRICRQNPELDLKGRHITFGNTTGVCCHGNILLRHDDIAQNWLWILRSVARYQHLIYKIPTVELYLSTLLGGMELVRRRNRPPLADTYFREVRKFSRVINSYLMEHPDCLKENLADLKLTVECMTGPMLVGTSGEIHIPSNSPGFLAVGFLNKSAQVARQKQSTFNEKRQLKESLVTLCINRFSLRSLRWGDNISSGQLIVCCRHLLDDLQTLPVSLENCRLQINMFYSVMSDGEMCIPWNYAGDTYTER